MADFWRQLDILNPSEFRQPIHIIGCGGIGSPTAILLAKMGIQTIHLYDDDAVETHNLPNQMFRHEDLGKLKVEALQEICAGYMAVAPTANAVKYTDQRLTGVVISGVDSMSARSAIWSQVKMKLSIQLYIEARMGAEVGEVYALRPTDPVRIEQYEQSLYTDEEAVEAACTARAILYNTFWIASIIGNLVKKHAKREDVPYHVLFDVSNFVVRQER